MADGVSLPLPYRPMVWDAHEHRIRQRRMTREEFFPWAESQDVRYEFDGLEPVAMTGGSARHSSILLNAQFALRTRLRRACRPFGPDAGVSTIGNAVRYPDALVTCARFPDTLRMIPDVVVVFEVLSPTSGHVDRIVKPREYGAVPTILRYIIVEHASVAATMFERAKADDPWTVRTSTAGDSVELPEVGVGFPLLELYGGTDLLRGEVFPPESEEG